jgi:hypothetical protein
LLVDGFEAVCGPQFESVHFKSLELAEFHL